MPYIDDAEWRETKRAVDELQKKVENFSVLLRNFKGAPPGVQGYAGKKLDLNDNLNVIELFKKIDSWTITVTQEIKFKFSATREPRLYLYMTLDGGRNWNECQSWPA